MSDPKAPVLGPYKSTRTTKLEFTPFTLTVTTVDDSTHVPPAPCGCGGGGGISEIVANAMAAMARASAPMTPDEPDEPPAE